MPLPPVNAQFREGDREDGRPVHEAAGVFVERNAFGAFKRSRGCVLGLDAEGMRKLFAGYQERAFAPRTHTIEEVLGKSARSIEQFATEVLQPSLCKVTA